MNHYLIDLPRDDKALWKVDDAVIEMFTKSGEYFDVTYLLDSDYAIVSMLEPTIKEYEWSLVSKAKEVVDLSTELSTYCILEQESFS